MVYFRGNSISFYGHEVKWLIFLCFKVDVVQWIVQRAISMELVEKVKCMCICILGVPNSFSASAVFMAAFTAQFVKDTQAYAI